MAQHTDQPTAADAHAFLRAAYGSVPPGHWFHLWTRQDLRTYWCHDVEDAIRCALRLAPTHDVYAGIALSGADLGPSQRVKATTASGIVGLGADIDFQGAAHTSSKAYPPSESAALEVVAGVPLAPTVTVHSGHGIQCWWLLREPWVFSEPGEREAAADLLKAWGHTVAAAARELGWEVDTVSDLARLLRVPGTVNRKDTPVPVRILNLDGARRYEPVEFRQHVTTGSPQRRPGAPTPLSAGHQLILSAAAEPDPDLLARCLQDATFRATWGRTRRDLRDTSDSGWDMALATRCAAMGLTPQETADMMIAHRRHHKGKPKLRPNYYWRTIEKAGRGLQSRTTHARPPSMADAPCSCPSSGTEPSSQGRVGYGWNACTSSPPVSGLAPPDPQRLMEVLPDSGFIRAYHDWVRPTTCAPAHFHLFAGLFCVAGAVGRRLRINYSTGGIYPNLYLAILAPSSRFHKSSAQRGVQRLLGGLTAGSNGEGEGTAESPLLPRETTPEAFFDVLAKRPTGVLVWDEMGQQLQRFGRDYMAGTVEFLTEIYDCPEEPMVRRTRKAEWRIDRPCVSIFGASTVDWLENNLTESLMLGGFLPRWLLVPATRAEQFIATPPGLDDAVGDDLKRQLAALREQYPADSITPVDISGIRGPYENWAESVDASVAGGPNEQIMAAWSMRLIPLSLKLAMLFELGSTGEPVVSEESWERARTVADFARGYLDALVNGDDALALTPYQRDRRRVLRVVVSGGCAGVTRAALCRETRIRKRELDEAVDGLLEEQRIAAVAGSKPERGPAPVVYLAVEHLAT